MLQSEEEPDGGGGESTLSPQVISAEPSKESTPPVVADPPTPTRVEAGHHHVDKEVESLQHQVKMLLVEKEETEQQIQLINTEYRKILAQKEVGHSSLKMFFN